MSDTSNRWIQLLLAGLLPARSAVFVFWEQSSIDSNQAVIGLMAKHVSELRAFSAFMYGQNYMLAVEAWLAAPLFAVAGPSLVAPSCRCLRLTWPSRCAPSGAAAA